jgi:type IV pilus assembly protein PilN
MRITLNLATRPFADQGPVLKRLRIAMGSLVLVSAALLLGLHALHSKAEAARARAHSLDGAIVRVTQEQRRYIDVMKEPANARLLRQTVALNKLFDEKAFSWTLTMESLETVLPGGVQVSTLEPVREKDGHITLHMRVLGPRDKGVVFVSNLEHSRRFLMPRIVDESAETSNGSGQQLEPVSDTNRFSFDLLADYNPPTPGELNAVNAAKKMPAAAARAPEIRPRRASPAERVQGRPPYRETPRPMQPAKPNPDGYSKQGGPR